jgi:hypothetical protein
MSRLPKAPVAAFTVMLGVGVATVVLGSTGPLRPGIGAVLALLASLVSVPILIVYRHPFTVITIELGVGVLLAVVIVNWLHGVSPLTSLKWYYQALVGLITPITHVKP